MGKPKNSFFLKKTGKLAKSNIIGDYIKINIFFILNCPYNL